MSVEWKRSVLSELAVDRVERLSRVPPPHRAGRTMRSL